jgi:hypothetical protein
MVFFSKASWNIVKERNILKSVVAASCVTGTFSVTQCTSETSAGIAALFQLRLVVYCSWKTVPSPAAIIWSSVLRAIHILHQFYWVRGDQSSCSWRQCPGSVMFWYGFRIRTTGTLIRIRILLFLQWLSRIRQKISCFSWVFLPFVNYGYNYISLQS